MVVSGEWKKHGLIWPLGIPVSQTWLDIGAILKIVHEQEIKFVLEIGMEHGGLSSLFLSRMERQVHYFGFEIEEKKVHSKISGANYYIGDAWEPKCVEMVEIIMSTEGKAFILCDGGNKVKDFSTYFPLMRAGDWIALHDFGKEFRETDLPQTDLKPYRPDWMEDTNWLVFHKED